MCSAWPGGAVRCGPLLNNICAKFTDLKFAQTPPSTGEQSGYLAPSPASGISDIVMVSPPSNMAELINNLSFSRRRNAVDYSE